MGGEPRYLAGDREAAREHAHGVMRQWDRAAALALTQKPGPSQRDVLLMAEQLPAALDAIDRVHALHRIEEYSGGGPESSDGAVCLGCGYELGADETACPTVRALDGEQ